MWIKLEDSQKALILNQVSAETGLPEFVIEKDWWVCIVLKAVFESKYADSIVFKGGTSLSKAYHLIERFSEDIDLVIDRYLLGFDELTSKSQIKRLRKASGGFIINEFRKELISQLNQIGVGSDQYEIRYNDHVDDTSDPNTLEIYYQSIVPVESEYIQQRVLLEMGARSLAEPSEVRPVVSFLDKQFETLEFALHPIVVQVVVPTRTFIEKALLLHEEFSKPVDKIRTERLSRHLYDLERMMDTDYGTAAVVDDQLFETIVEHRKNINRLRGMDYSNHVKGKLKIIPPNDVIKDWQDDYKTMQNNMISGESLAWDKLLGRIKVIENRMNRLD